MNKDPLDEYYVCVFDLIPIRHNHHNLEELVKVGEKVELEICAKDTLFGDGPHYMCRLIKGKD